MKPARPSDQSIDPRVAEARMVIVAGTIARNVTVACQQRLEESRGRGIVCNPTIDDDLRPDSRVTDRGAGAGIDARHGSASAVGDPHEPAPTATPPGLSPTFTRAITSPVARSMSPTLSASSPRPETGALMLI